MNIRLINTDKILNTQYLDKTILISSYCFENLDKRVAESQMKVFEKFGLSLNQFVGSVRHPDFMDYIINNFEYDYFIFFDIDCIPMKKNIVEIILDRIGNNSLIGIEQQCNSNASENHIYAGPACFGISKIFYEELERPSFKENYRSDVAEEITYLCESKGKKINFFKKTSSDNEIWKLGDGYFGHGTVYEKDLLYHQFQIAQNIEKFINKCDQILNKNS